MVEARPLASRTRDFLRFSERLVTGDHKRFRLPLASLAAEVMPQRRQHMLSGVAVPQSWR